MSNNNKLSYILTIMLVAGVLFLTGMAKRPIPSIKIAMPTWIGYAPLLIVDELKLDEKNGFDLKLERIDNVQAIMSGLAAGKLDGVCTTIDAAVRARSADIPVKIVLGFDSSHGGDGLVVSEKIQKVTDLKGKNVALQVGSPSHFFLLNVITQNGLAPGDVNVVPMEPGDAGAAFVAGKVDAAVTWEPWLSNAGQRKGGRTMVSSADMPGLIVDILAVTEHYMKGNLNVVANFSKAWFAALEYVHNKPKKSYDIMAKGLGIPVEDTKAMATGITFYGPKENRDLFFGVDSKKESAAALVKKANKFWRALQITEKEVPSSEIVDNRPLSTALDVK